jgi:predicted DCC family thiol-disulfide oxidoreductase YuxK
MTDALPAGRSVQVFFDGDCPLCMREIRMLMRKDKASRIEFTDIAAPDFDAARYNTTYDHLMKRIRGRVADGRWIEGVEVFRQLYAAIGWRKIVAVTRVPGISHLLSLGYRLFAANRLRLTGRRCDKEGCAIPKARPHATHVTPTASPAVQTGAAQLN